MEKFTFTPLNEAYNIHHVNTQSYTRAIQYSSQCIFCSNQDTIALMQAQDNGSFRKCNNRSCRKQFRELHRCSNATQHECRGGFVRQHHYWREPIFPEPDCNHCS